MNFGYFRHIFLPSRIDFILSKRRNLVKFKAEMYSYAAYMIAVIIHGNSSFRVYE